MSIIVPVVGIIAASFFGATGWMYTVSKKTSLTFLTVT